MTIDTRPQRRPAYYRAVARAVGVPEFWLDDATQDIALATWRDGKAHDVTAIRREAIDAARRYGPYTRYGNRRPTFVPLDAAHEMGVPFGERYELRTSLRNALDELTDKQREAIGRRVEQLPMTSLDSAHASAARRKLKKELAGDWPLWA